jgi:hypothetical protein
MKNTSAAFATPPHHPSSKDKDSSPHRLLIWHIGWSCGSYDRIERPRIIVRVYSTEERYRSIHAFHMLSVQVVPLRSPT